MKVFPGAAQGSRGGMSVRAAEGTDGARAGNQIVLPVRSGRKHRLTAARTALAAPVLPICDSRAPSGGTCWPPPRLFRLGAINPSPTGKTRPPLGAHVLTPTSLSLAPHTSAHRGSSPRAAPTGLVPCGMSHRAPGLPPLRGAAEARQGRRFPRRNSLSVSPQV